MLRKRLTGCEFKYWSAARALLAFVLVLACLWLTRSINLTGSQNVVWGQTFLCTRLRSDEKMPFQALSMVPSAWRWHREHWSAGHITHRDTVT